MKHKKQLTHSQFAINNKTLRDTARTDSWLKQNGLNVDAVATVCGEVLIAQKKAHELLKHHAKLLTPEQLKLLKTFEDRLSNKKKRKKMKPSSAYPILNLCTKIARQAYRNEMLAQQKIQALRQKQQ
jgi:hypothetical protein